mgnify:CR=1 FL=1
MVCFCGIDTCCDIVLSAPLPLVVVVFVFSFAAHPTNNIQQQVINIIILKSFFITYTSLITLYHKRLSFSSVYQSTKEHKQSYHATHVCFLFARKLVWARFEKKT